MQHITDEMIDVFRRYPYCAELYIDVCGGQRLRLDALQHLHINSKIRVTLRGCACNIKFGTYIARKILVRRLPFLCLRVEKDLLSQRRSNLFLRHTVEQR